MADQTDNPSNPRLSMPAELRAFSEPCSLLPGESRSDFEVIRQMMIDDIQPETNMEWLWTLDLIELSWEILRYRSLKQRVLAEYRHSAIRAILLRLDGEGCQSNDFNTLNSKSGGSLPNGAPMQMPRLRLRQDCDDTALMRPPSIRRCFSRHENPLPCSMISCTPRKTGAWYCFGKSTSDASLRSARRDRQMP
jgi:hypothetical protein